MFMNLQALDGGILLWLQSVRQPLLDGILTLYTQLGNAGVAWIVLSVVLLFFRRTRKGGALALCAMLFGLIGTNLVPKNLFQRMRPYEVVEGLTHLVHITDPNSFPSGHTTAAFAAGVSPELVGDAVTLAVQAAREEGEATEEAVAAALEQVLRRHPGWRADARRAGNFRLGADEPAAPRPAAPAQDAPKRWNRFR